MPGLSNQCVVQFPLAIWPQPHSMPVCIDVCDHAQRIGAYFAFVYAYYFSSPGYLPEPKRKIKAQTALLNHVYLADKCNLFIKSSLTWQINATHSVASSQRNEVPEVSSCHPLSKSLIVYSVAVYASQLWPFPLSKRSEWFLKQKCSL